ncbi:AbfB domain-containing protein [Streptomyces sp. AV19]|uniref:AbfB domain-containing protein n=1 Tax=Streptomyces sp. AV19 TaxID=2793068 RepID=UPI0018FEDA38|nr:AbfB domain-containing protein [Streptomyces sp. AV19]MBH1933070.1 AbfB domain-containing protein [Streptomyces sp. AV19]MDG4531782.1 AbfB domain-containing protein [Streptomyces sp. AV19]
MHKRHLASARVRRIVTRGLVTTTALAAVTGVVAQDAALAAPSGAVAQADAIGTDGEQRVAAAAVIDFFPSNANLQLSDYEFIRLLWQKAGEPGEKWTVVRTAAEAAMASSSAEDHVRFIVTGIVEAGKTDKKRQDDKAEADRAARLAKSQALLAVGIPSTPELLGLSDDNFIRAVVNHSAAGPEVRKAGIKALAGGAADWREFIVNGAREAHARDWANHLKELEEKDRKEAERRRELAARTAAAALFRTAPTEAMLALGDDNFIRELLRTAPDDLRGSELYAAAQRAVLSSDPAEWKKFIHSGAEEAYKRDDEIRRKTLAEENRKAVLRIQALAENGGLNPNLVAAAKKALSGTDEEVAEFLKKDNQYRARRQSFRVSGGEWAGWYIRRSGADGDEAFLGPVDSGSKQAVREDATWVIVPALANNPGCFSFESVSKSGHYLKLKHGTDDVRVSPDDGSRESREDATWCPREGATGSGNSFVSASDPDKWLQSHKGVLHATDRIGTAFADAATWNVSSPLAR